MRDSHSSSLLIIMPSRRVRWSNFFARYALVRQVNRSRAKVVVTPDSLTPDVQADYVFKDVYQFGVTTNFSGKRYYRATAQLAQITAEDSLTRAFDVFPELLRKFTYPADASYIEGFPVWTNGFVELLRRNPEIKQIVALGSAHSVFGHALQLACAETGTALTFRWTALSWITHQLEKGIAIHSTCANWGSLIASIGRGKELPITAESLGKPVAFCLRSRQMPYLVPICRKAEIHLVSHRADGTPSPALLQLLPKLHRLALALKGIGFVCLLRLCSARRIYAKFSAELGGSPHLARLVFEEFFSSLFRDFASLLPFHAAIEAYLRDAYPPFVLVADTTQVSRVILDRSKAHGAKTGIYYFLDDGLLRTRELLAENADADFCFCSTQGLEAAVRATLPRVRARIVGTPQSTLAGSRAEEREKMAAQTGLDPDKPWWLILSRHVSDPLPRSLKQRLFVEPTLAARQVGAQVCVRTHPHESAETTASEARAFGLAELIFCPKLDLSAVSPLFDAAFGPESTSSFVEIARSRIPIFALIHTQGKASQGTAGNAAFVENQAALPWQTADEIAQTWEHLQRNPLAKETLIGRAMKMVEQFSGPLNLDPAQEISAALKEAGLKL